MNTKRYDSAARSTTVADLNALERKQEIIFDISMELGIFWNQQGQFVRMDMIDSVGGSRGLRDLVMTWVDEFDGAWERLPDGHDKDYIREVRLFSKQKLTAFAQKTAEGKGLVMAVSAQHIEKLDQYVTRFNRYYNRVKALRDMGAPILSEKETKWLEGALAELMSQTKDVEMRRVTKALRALAGKLVMLRNKEGVTYKKLAETIGLSLARTQQYVAEYKRALNSSSAVGLKELRALPWHEVK